MRLASTRTSSWARRRLAVFKARRGTAAEVLTDELPFIGHLAHAPRALLPPCRRAYLYRPMEVGTMTPCDLGQRTLLRGSRHKDRPIAQASGSARSPEATPQNLKPFLGGVNPFGPSWY